MASEKFANLAETTLASAYTSGTTTLSVTSAVGFPTVGVFRVRLGNAGKTIWRVDSVSGTTFTGAAEANDANANSADAVKIVASRQVAERFLQSPETGAARSPSGVSAADFYGPIHKLTDFDPTGWTWANQGSATITKTNGFSELATPSAAGENNRTLVTTAPATPYKFGTLMVPSRMWPNANQAWGGLCLKESGTGKIIAITLRSRSGPDLDIHVRKLTNETTFSADGPTTVQPLMQGPIFLRVGADGTNVTFEYSFDGVFWITLLSEAKATFFTTAPDRYGLIIRNNSGTDTAVVFCGLNQT